MSPIRLRFDIDTLQDLVGAKVFARGRAYAQSGQVQILVLEPSRVLARVTGTKEYRTEIIGSGTKIGGKCSCPAYEDFGFCKHMVATALAANKTKGDDMRDANPLARIRDHLKTKSKDALIDMIIGVAETDDALLRKLEMAASLAKDDDKTLEARLRKAIDAATRTNGYMEYDEAADWAAGIDPILDVIADLPPGGRPSLALKLAEHAIGRIERAVENIDDSDGAGAGLLQRAQEIHLEAARAAPPDPIPFARYLFTRETQEGYDTFYQAAQLYADVLGEGGLAEYRRLAVEAWEKLPTRAGKSRQHGELIGGYEEIRDILEFFAERDGDVDARIALRTKDLSSPWNYRQLVEFCLSHGRPEEALRWAEEGLWVFEDRTPDEELVVHTAELLSKAGRNEDAGTQLRRAFEKAPSLKLYIQLGKFAGKAASERAIAFLQARLVGDKSTSAFSRPADLLISILTHEKTFDAAWAATRKYSVSAGIQAALARASEKTHANEALEIYAGEVDRLVETGGNPSYEAAAKLIARMATLQSAAVQSAYVTSLKSRWSRKRNFMRLLE